MKSKALTFIVLAILGFSASSFSQNDKKSSNISSVVWLGVDFTAAKFIDVAEDPATIVNQYLSSINSLIITERDKYNIKKFFNIAEVNYSIDLANEFNKKIDPATLVISQAHKIEIDKVKEVIKKYDLKDKTGTGLIFVAENLSKTAKSGTFWVCFFDLKSKEIIDCKHKEGAVSGIGFRNFWASSVYSVMKTWTK